MKPATWFSLYHEIEVLVARQMIAEGKLRPLPDIYPGMPHEFNSLGERVRLAVLVPSQYLSEFERRIIEMRA
jgi:hypothetical protein